MLDNERRLLDEIVPSFTSTRQHVEEEFKRVKKELDYIVSLLQDRRKMLELARLGSPQNNPTISHVDGNAQTRAALSASPRPSGASRSSRTVQTNPSAQTGNPCSDMSPARLVSTPDPGQSGRHDDKAGQKRKRNEHGDGASGSRISVSAKQSKARVTITIDVEADEEQH